MSDELTNEQMDSMVDNLGSESNREIPMSTSEPAVEAKPVDNTPKEIEFTWNGKPIKAPIEKATQWASQGYDYAQKMAEFNKNKTEFETKSKTYEDTFKRYQDVDNYAKENPEWFKSVMDAYEQKRGVKADPNDPISQKLSMLENKLSELDKFKQELTTKETAQKRQEQDSALDKDVRSIQEQYKDLDWKSVNQDGKTLELQVLEHANANGISNFRAAFRDFYHEQLVKAAEEKGKETVANARKQQTKLGLLSTNSTPTKKLGDAVNVKAKSYEDLMREGLEEIGIGAH